jgi:hypothetical protein
LVVSIDRGTILSLGEALQAAEEMSRRADHLYVEDVVEAWNEASQCVVVELDPYEEEPAEVDVDGVLLHRSLSASQVQGVVLNLRSAIRDPTPPQLVAALQYYFEFDAFIDPSALRVY